MVDALDRLRHWPGRCAVAVGGVPVDTLMRRIRRFASLDNPMGIDWVGPLYLHLGDLIAEIGGGLCKSV